MDFVFHAPPPSSLTTRDDGRLRGDQKSFGRHAFRSTRSERFFFFPLPVFVFFSTKWFSRNRYVSAYRKTVVIAHIRAVVTRDSAEAFLRCSRNRFREFRATNGRRGGGTVGRFSSDSLRFHNSVIQRCTTKQQNFRTTFFPVLLAFISIDGTEVPARSRHVEYSATS